jgi:hypothetical protein
MPDHQTTPWDGLPKQPGRWHWLDDGGTLLVAEWSQQDKLWFIPALGDKGSLPATAARAGYLYVARCLPPEGRHE